MKSWPEIFARAPRNLAPGTISGFDGDGFIDRRHLPCNVWIINRVQDFGQIRDLDDISRREKAWAGFIHHLEAKHGRPAGALPADVFRADLESGLDLESFERTSSA